MFFTVMPVPQAKLRPVRWPHVLQFSLSKQLPPLPSPLIHPLPLNPFFVTVMPLTKRSLPASAMPPFKRAKPSHPAAILHGSALTAPPLHSHYQLGAELGRGQFGVIRRCINTHTGETCACKSIAKANLVSAEDAQDVRMEVEIMKLLTGHPNIVGLRDVFEDSEHIHIIMELCEGGELFHRIVEGEPFSEKDAAVVMKSLVEVVKYCHEMGVMHRDLKPENILLSTASPFSPIKIADFGLAQHFVPGQRFSRTVGSAYYIAPEVLKHNYSNQVDLWSLGIILYVLLSGVPPFWGDTEQMIFHSINEGKLDFDSEPWPLISMPAKELIQGLLNLEATARLTAEQVLTHPWILHHTSQTQLSERSFSPPEIMGEEAELYSLNSTANFSWEVEKLEDHFLLPYPDLTAWEIGSFQPLQVSQDALVLQQHLTEVGTKPLELDYLLELPFDTSFSPYSVSSTNLVEFRQEVDISPPLVRDSFSAPVFLESTLSGSSSTWLGDASFDVLTSSAPQLGFKEQDGCSSTVMTVEGIESKLMLDTEVLKLDDIQKNIAWYSNFVADSCMQNCSSCLNDLDFSVLQQTRLVF